ncbi:unnamed protein product [Closterium sp. NIES-53]
MEGSSSTAGRGRGVNHIIRSCLQVLKSHPAVGTCRLASYALSFSSARFSLAVLSSSPSAAGSFPTRFISSPLFALALTTTSSCSSPRTSRCSLAMAERGVSLPDQLVGFSNFKRHNPKSDRFEVLDFHHVEFWCGDATSTSGRFSWGLGMPLVAKSDLTTGNQTYCSYALKSNDLVFVFSAPYGDHGAGSTPPAAAAPATNGAPMPWFERKQATEFFARHGLAVRAVGVKVTDAQAAYEMSVSNGATGVVPPTKMVDSKDGGSVTISEVALYGDVVLRYVAQHSSYSGPFLPNYAPASNAVSSYGLTRLDHAVGNVPKLLDAVRHILNFTGFHEFAEFVAADVGTLDSGLNSMVLANNAENVLFPINEPTFGTPRKSQIQTYLEHNEGPGLQHLALSCTDIIATLQEMRARTELGGFDFMPRPSANYYKELPKRIGPDSGLSEKLLKDCETLGVLVDRDDQGVLLQIFTRPVGDRPTLFLEIIQRVGCMYPGPDGTLLQKGGCGGFGKGNFSELAARAEDDAYSGSSGEAGQKAEREAEQKAERESGERLGGIWTGEANWELEKREGEGGLRDRETTEMGHGGSAWRDADAEQAAWPVPRVVESRVILKDFLSVRRDILALPSGCSSPYLTVFARPLAVAVVSTSCHPPSFLAGSDL